MRGIFAGFFLSLLVFAAANQAHAQPPDGITASTNNHSYEPGDQVIITGTVQPVTDQNPVTIIVRNPIGNVYAVGQVILTNNMFIDEFTLNDNSQGGLYTVNIRQDTKTTQIQFQVIAGKMQIIPVFDSEIRVTGPDTNLVKYETVHVSNADNSITIGVETSKLQSGSVMEKYHIPKRVIDASMGQLVVQENGNSVACSETASDTESVLICPISEGTREITMIGTSVIPEFGMSSASVLAMTVAMMILFYSRGRFLHHYR